jgi:dUTP pyrophosphatase
MSEQRGGIAPDTEGSDVQDAGNGPHGGTTGPVMPVALDEGAVLPGRAHEDDAGFDLTAAEAVHIPAGGRALVGTGVSIALPQGTVGLVCPRSGLAVRHGLTVLNGPGIIDAGYRGEVRVPLHNTDLEAGIDLAPGDRIAQLVVVPFLAPTLEVVPDATHLTSSTRQNDGFGSSGGLSGRTGAVPSGVAAHDGKE